MLKRRNAWKVSSKWHQRKYEGNISQEWSGLNEQNRGNDDHLNLKGKCIKGTKKIHCKKGKEEKTRNSYFKGLVEGKNKVITCLFNEVKEKKMWATFTWYNKFGGKTAAAAVGEERRKMVSEKKNETWNINIRWDKRGDGGGKWRVHPGIHDKKRKEENKKKWEGRTTVVLNNEQNSNKKEEERTKIIFMLMNSQHDLTLWSREEKECEFLSGFSFLPILVPNLLFALSKAITKYEWKVE